MIEGRTILCFASGCDRHYQRSWKIVREHYHDRGWRSERTLYRQVLAELLEQSMIVLEVGCGRSFPEAGFLLEHAGEVHGIDPVIDPPPITAGARVLRGSAEHIPYRDAIFDVLASITVLEHRAEPAVAFREFYRVLKPGGRVVLLTSNRHDYISLASMIIPTAFHAKIVRRLEGRLEADTFPTYYRANTQSRIRRIAKATGFLVERLDYLHEYPSMFMHCPILCRVAIAYDELFRSVRCLRWLQGAILGVLRRPPSDVMAQEDLSETPREE